MHFIKNHLCHEKKRVSSFFMDDSNTNCFSFTTHLCSCLLLALFCTLSGMTMGEPLSNHSEKHTDHPLALDQGIDSQPAHSSREIWYGNTTPGRSALFLITAAAIAKTKTSFNLDCYDFPASAVDNLIYALIREREKDINSVMDSALSHSGASEIISSAGHLLFGLYFFPEQPDSGTHAPTLYTLRDMSSIWSIRAGLIRLSHLASKTHTEWAPELTEKDNHYILAPIFIFQCSTLNLLHQQPVLKAIAKQACSVGFSLYGKGRFQEIKEHKLNHHEATMEYARETLVIGAVLLYTKDMGLFPALTTIIGSQLIKQGAGFSLEAFKQEFLSEASYVGYLLDYSLEVSILFLADISSLHSHNVVQSTYISKLRDAAIYDTGIRLIEQISWLINKTLIMCTDFL